MNRRDTVFALAALGVAPLASFALEQEKLWRIGFLGFPVAPVYAGRLEVWRVRLRELGYVEGKNLAIEWRFADGQAERLSILAAELVRLNVDLIVTAGVATSAARNATTTIPIVMIAQDPIGSGFVNSLARPGGNVTGVSNLASDLGPKHLEMLISMVPKLSRVAVLMDPSVLAHAPILKSILAAAQKMKVKILPAEARNPQEIESAFSMMIREKAGAVIVLQDAIYFQQQHRIMELAIKNRLPSVSPFREYAEEGGLMSYGHNLADNWRLVATYVDKIFKGAKPRDLPVEQPTTFELLINRKTAKALGIAIPREMLLRADRVIE